MANQLYDALIAPLYLPFAMEGGSGDAAPPEGVESTIHMGGINVYLQQNGSRKPVYVKVKTLVLRLEPLEGIT